MAAKIRFQYEDLETYAEGVLDTRGRKGQADVPVHYKAVRLKIRIQTEETDKRLQRLADLVARYCPVDSLVGAAVPDYEVVWERMARPLTGDAAPAESISRDQEDGRR